MLYYSLAVGYLHVWLLVPTRGIVKFHQVRVSDANDEGKSGLRESRGGADSDILMKPGSEWSEKPVLHGFSEENQA